MEVDAEELGNLEGGSCVGQDSKAEMLESGVSLAHGRYHRFSGS